MWGYISLVAGEGEPGFKDGGFASAWFDGPSALALDDDGTRLFVADKGNHRIRVIDLGDKNEVGTLAGTGEAGSKDGDFKTAEFNQPSLLLLLPQNRLLAYDAGAQLFRLLDLGTRKVSTLLSASDKGAHGLALGGVAGMVYTPKENAVYFSQPGYQALRRLDLATREVRTLQTDARLPNPCALCLYKNGLCVADAALPSVYLMEPRPNTGTALIGVSLTEIGQGGKIIAMAASGVTLYALQSGENPWVRIAPKPGPVSPMSVWGQLMGKGTPEIANLLNESAAGFIPDPRQQGDFYFALPRLNCVLSLKDYGFEANKDAWGNNPSNGMKDFDYPVPKPPHTFRILEVGGSHLFLGSEAEKNADRWPWGYNTMETNPKELELFLNTLASLGDDDYHYQVFNDSSIHNLPANLKADLDFPLVQRFDIDLCLIYVHADFIPNIYFENPYLKEGVPDAYTGDGEFRLKPLQERLKEDKDPVASDLYQRCLDHHWVKTGSSELADLDTITSDPKVRQDLVEIAVRPLKLLAAKVQAAKTSGGRPVGLAAVFMPLGLAGPSEGRSVDSYRAFWTDVFNEAGIPFYDISDKMAATRWTYYPTNDFRSFHHFNHGGHLYFAFLMAQELMKDKLIPLQNK